MTKPTDGDTVNSLPSELTPHIFRGHSLGDRRGQPCRIVALNGQTAYIEFRDGFKAHVPRYTVRRKKGVRDAIEKGPQPKDDQPQHR